MNILFVQCSIEKPAKDFVNSPMNLSLVITIKKGINCNHQSILFETTSGMYYWWYGQDSETRDQDYKSIIDSHSLTLTH